MDQKAGLSFDIKVVSGKDLLFLKNRTAFKRFVTCMVVGAWFLRMYGEFYRACPQIVQKGSYLGEQERRDRNCT